MKGENMDYYYVTSDIGLKNIVHSIQDFLSTKLDDKEFKNFQELLTTLLINNQTRKNFIYRGKIIDDK